MQDRILTIINLLLVAVCGGCIWFLATRHYERPQEIANARIMLEKPESNFRGDSGYVPVTTVYANLNKQFTSPLYTPTPTPTPTPPPPPAPANLNEATAAWVIQSLDTDNADIVDNKSPDKEPFTLKVGGPGHVSNDNRGLPCDVKLESVNLDEFKATFSFGAQKVTKSL